jgi:hypothetical protein
MIIFKDGVDVDATVHDLAQAHGLTVRLVYRHALRGMAASVPEGRLKALARDPRVAYVEADQEVHLFVQEVPTGIRRIFADENANITIDGVDDLRVDVDVAVIDTGIDFEHPDLNVVARTDCSGGSPFKQSCKDGSGKDGNGHGTHVAGTIGAIDNDIGVVGVAPGARLWAVKVLRDDGSGYISWIVAGIDWVTARADQIEVANMSLGCECTSQAMDDAIANSVAAGVVYAVAAGNDDKDAAAFSPANHPDVITVSALADFDGEPGGLGPSTCRSDQDDTLADFSNWGDLIEVTAPGVCILSTWKDGGYNTISGTSMASPHVAGAAALLASGANDPSSKAEVEAIRQTLIDTGNFDWTDDSGDGIQEPLLDVSDSSVFAPATVTGSGGGSTNEPPSVTITSPEDGATVSETIEVTADASDQDGSVAQVEFFVDDSSIGVDEDGSDGWSVSWDTTTVSDGDHTLTAEATDDGGATATDSISVTVDNGSGDIGTDMYVWAIDFSQKDYGRGGSFHDLVITVTIRQDSDADGVAEGTDDPLSNASVDLTLTHDSDGDKAYDCTTDDECWNFAGTTDGAGQVTFTLKFAATGDYEALVTALTHSTFTWNPELDADNPDYYTLQ